MRGAAIEESLALPLPRLPLLGTLGKQTVSLNVPLHSLRVGASDRQMAVFRAWPIIQATALRKACRHRPLLIQELQLLAAPAVLPGAPPTGLRSLWSIWRSGPVSLRDVRFSLRCADLGQKREKLVLGSAWREGEDPEEEEGALRRQRMGGPSSVLPGPSVQGSFKPRWSDVLVRFCCLVTLRGMRFHLPARCWVRSGRSPRLCLVPPDGGNPSTPSPGPWGGAESPEVHLLLLLRDHRQGS